jgi:hypothetical protein
MPQTVNCACGQPLHYSSDETRQMIERMVEELGPFVVVHVGGSAWKVQRHYLALHGIKASELPELSLRLGFAKIYA